MYPIFLAILSFYSDKRLITYKFFDACRDAGNGFATCVSLLPSNTLLLTDWLSSRYTGLLIRYAVDVVGRAGVVSDSLTEELCSLWFLLLAKMIAGTALIRGWRFTANIPCGPSSETVRRMERRVSLDKGI